MTKVYITARSISELRDAQNAGERIEYKSVLFGWTGPENNGLLAYHKFNFDAELGYYRIVREEPEKLTVPHVHAEGAAKPHVHAATIKAWADGAVVETRSPIDPQYPAWRTAGKLPNWGNATREWRVKPAPDPYAELKAAHAEGKPIEVNLGGDWHRAYHPSWHHGASKYRIKPEPLVEVRYARASAADKEPIPAPKAWDDALSSTWWSVRKGGQDNLKATFEDGKLKGVEII